MIYAKFSAKLYNVYAFYRKKFKVYAKINAKFWKIHAKTNGKLCKIYAFKRRIIEGLR